jgi:hypothetical protein
MRGGTLCHTPSIGCGIDRLRAQVTVHQAMVRRSWPTWVPHGQMHATQNSL